MSSSRGGQGSRSAGRQSKGKGIQIHDSPPNRFSSGHDSSQWVDDDEINVGGENINIDVDASPWVHNIDQILEGQTGIGAASQQPPPPTQQPSTQHGERRRRRPTTSTGTGNSTRTDGGNLPDHVQRILDRDRVSSSPIFNLHYERIWNSEWEQIQAKCNYCGHLFAQKKSGGYGTLHQHIIQKHPDKVPNTSDQRQIHFAPNVEGGLEQQGLW